MYCFQGHKGDTRVGPGVLRTKEVPALRPRVEARDARAGLKAGGGAVTRMVYYCCSCCCCFLTVVGKLRGQGAPETTHTRAYTHSTEQVYVVLRNNPFVLIVTHVAQ